MCSFNKFSSEAGKMAITVVGSVAYDSIETPAAAGPLPGRRGHLLFAGRQLLYRCARDRRGGRGLWPEQEAVFKARNIDTRGIERARARASSGKARISKI
jgi:hypothetical protein